MAVVIVTGAGGFLGRRLTSALLAGKTLHYAAGAASIDRLILVDRYPVKGRISDEVSVEILVGDLSDAPFLRRVAGSNPDSIFHLAASLTLDSERDPAASYAANVETARGLMEQTDGCPTFVFTSSLAVYGGELPECVGDNVALKPSTTYGVHKVIIEQLIADHSRHGTVDGRALRLPIVVTRPRSGEGTPALSDFVASMIREPLDGRDVVIPLAAETRFPIVSAGAAVRALIELHDAAASDLPLYRAFSLPSLTLSGQQIVGALPAFADGRYLGTVAFQPDPSVLKVVQGWPTVLASAVADRLNIRGDACITDIVRDHLNNRVSG